MKQTRILRQLNKLLKRVNSYQDTMRNLTDVELSQLTVKFREQLASGKTTDDILPEAFAAVREADGRILGKYPYDVQVLGGIALHKGCLAEMNTGEGKTLVATMPLYLNALTGKSTILLTTNEYLALRDEEEMGAVYRFLGLTVSAGVKARAEESFTNEEKKRVYDADIVYTTHGAFGFDYLLNNLVTTAEDRFLRELYYVIIDEADSVLLDSAQTPLVISGAPRVQSNLYELADFFVTTLVEDRDYETEEKKVWLTEAGVKYAEQFFGIDNFYGSRYFEINRHVTLALRAHVLFEPERDYVVAKDGELQLLDNGSGRMMRGVKLRGGQHQALEIKEKLKLSSENRSVASITYQNLFLLFPKMSGMSGTISDAAEELESVYGSRVVVIPPNCPVRRQDAADIYFRNADSQFQAALTVASARHATGQPVLIVVSTIAETELVSKMLMERKIAHSVLNANNAFWEADMVKEAGQMNAVTVATSIAGRGTDIKLGEGVAELGGLAVIGIGRMANVRQERQARGRAGRQGDPGFSNFFVSLEDDVVTQGDPEKYEKYSSGKRRIGRRKLQKIIDSAQKLGEEYAVMSRKQAQDYDQVMQKQRKVIYATRDALLDGEGMETEDILSIAEKNINGFFRENKGMDLQTVRRYILDNISYRLEEDPQLSQLHLEQARRLSGRDRRALKQILLEKIRRRLAEQEACLGSPEYMDDFVRVATLQAIDDAWVEQVDYLQQLQMAVGGRSSAQRNPVFEYEQEALVSFHRMEMTVLKNLMRNILLSNVYTDREQKLRILFP